MMIMTMMTYVFKLKVSCTIPLYVDRIHEYSPLIKMRSQILSGENAESSATQISPKLHTDNLKVRKTCLPTRLLPHRYCFFWVSYSVIGTELGLHVILPGNCTRTAHPLELLGTFLFFGNHVYTVTCRSQILPVTRHEAKLIPRTKYRFIYSRDVATKI